MKLRQSRTTSQDCTNNENSGLRASQSSWKVVSTVLVLLFGALSTPLVAQQYSEGEHYLAVPIPQEAEPSDKIEVIEFFSYGCIHCYRFETRLQQWLKNLPDDVEFRREHVIFQQSWVPLARAFYIAEKRGVLEEVHDDLFDAIHKHRVNMADEGNLRALFSNKADVEFDEFKGDYESFEIHNRLRASLTKMRAAQIDGVPTMLIDRRFVVTTDTARGAHRIISVVEFLVDKVREERKSDSS